MQAARLLEKGYSQSEVARRVGAHRQSVSQWAAELEQNGRAGLKKAGRAGRKPRLSAADLAKIEQGLKRGPEALGYETGLWTTIRVAHLIVQECGVAYHASQAWRILRQLGWSCQRPTGRALERNEETIQQWKKKRWPEIKKSPKRRPDDRLHRRKRTEPAPPPLPHLGAARANAGAAIPLQLENVVGDGGRHLLVELLLPALSRQHSQPAGDRVPEALAAPSSGKTVDRLGRVARSSQSSGVGLCAPAAGAPVAGVSSGLCTGAESSRVSVVALEATRTAELLSDYLWPVEPACPAGAAPNASTANFGDGLLGTGQPLPNVTILCNCQ